MQELLKKIAAQVEAFGGRLETLEGGSVEVKDLTEAGQAALAKTLAEMQDAGEIEMKSFTDRLDEFERKANAAGIDAEQAGEVEKKDFSVIDAAMRAGDDIEFKALDSDLKQQDVFLDSSVISTYPLLARVFTRQTKSDSPRVSFNTGATITVKGRGGAQVANVRKKVTLTVEMNEYQPTLEQEDVEDMGSLLIQDEFDEFKIASPEQINADIVDAIEAAEVAKAAVTDVYNEVAMIETVGVSVWADADFVNLIAELPVKLRRTACWTAAPATVAIMRNIVNPSTSKSQWVDGDASTGRLPTFKGYEVIEDENAADDVVIFGNARRGAAAIERTKAVLNHIERVGSTYKPHYSHRVARGLTDCRSWKILKNTA